MGGLFSEPEQPAPTFRSVEMPDSGRSSTSNSYLPTARYSPAVEVPVRPPQSHHAAPRAFLPSPTGDLKYVMNRPSLVPYVKRNELAKDWKPSVPFGAEYVLVDVLGDNPMHSIVRSLFTNTNQKFTINKIQQIQNPYLLGCYLLKKEEMKSRYGYVKETYLFHGTKNGNVNNICKVNLDWRRHGTNIGNRFGKGVSFSPISYYASHSSEKSANVKIMFLVRVLISNCVPGSQDMDLPPMLGNSTKRFDTTVKDNNHVMVKFCDNEFYPEFIIFYKVKARQY